MIRVSSPTQERPIAPQIAVPVLWFYAEDDQFIGPRVQKLWFESFRSAGDPGEPAVVPLFPERHGHGVFPSAAGTLLWTTAAARFFESQGLGVPFCHHAQRQTVQRGSGPSGPSADLVHRRLAARDAVDVLGDHRRARLHHALRPARYVWRHQHVR